MSGTETRLDAGIPMAGGTGAAPAPAAAHGAAGAAAAGGGIPSAAAAALPGGAGVHMHAMLRAPARHFAAPLYRNGYSLISSSVLTSALGLIYWFVAARSYSTVAVGVSSALISLTTTIANLAHLNLKSALNRFLPRAGSGTVSLVTRSYLIAMGVAALASVAFIAGVRVWSPRLAFLETKPLIGVCFVLATVAWTIFVLEDSALTGIRRATWVPLENFVYAVIKLAALPAFVIVAPLLGAFWSWTVTLPPIVIAINLLLFRRLLPAHRRATEANPERAGGRAIVRYVAADFLAYATLMAAMGLLPVVVLSVIGPKASAYYFISWAIAYGLYLIPSSMGMAMISEAVSDPASLARYNRDSMIESAKLMVPAVVVLVIGAPYLLRLLGADYQRGATTLLRLLVLSALPWMVFVSYTNIARVQQRMRAVVRATIALSVLVLGIGVPLMSRIGVSGLGVGWLAGQTLVAIGILVTWRIGRRPSKRALEPEAPPPPEAEVLPAAELTPDAELPPAVGLPPEAALTRKTGGSASAPPTPTATPTPPSPGRPDGHGSLLERGVRALSRARTRWRRLRSREDGRAITSMAELAAPGRGWVVQRSLITLHEQSVRIVGPAGGQPEAILRCASGRTGQDSLARHARALRELGAAQKLGVWRRLIPRVLATHELRGRSYLVESWLPGSTMESQLRAGAGPDRLIGAAVAAIMPLHSATAQADRVDQALIDELLERPLACLRATVAGPRHPRRRNRLERLGAELRTRLIGLRLVTGRIHGDLWPGNLLIGEDHAATGIVDWERDSIRQLRELDLLQLLIATRMIVDGCELGRVIVELRHHPGWRPYERAAAEALHDCGNPLPEDTLVLLTWLQQLAANLEKSTRYAHSPLWVRRNVDPVLRTYA